MDKICKCSCGRKIKWQKHHKYYGIPNYLIGHTGNRKGIPHTLKTKMKISLANKGNPGWCKGTKGVMKPNKTSFKKGEPPWNKYTKGICKYNSGTFKKGNYTPRGIQFKKGQRPWNYIDGRSKKLGPMRYGDDWERIRYIVYLRDKFTCQDCSITGKSLDIHHKIPYLISGDNSIENLTTLCRSCHMKEEQRMVKDRINIKIEVGDFLS